MAAKRQHPPRLTTTDRTLSVAIDNYAPTAALPTLSAIVGGDQRKSSNSLHAVSNQEKLFYMGRSVNNDDLGPRFTSRKPIIRRSDTLGVCNSNFFESGNHSFYNLENKSPLLYKRTASMKYSSPATKQQAPSKALADPSRRNCRMHRSFNDPQKHSDLRKDMIIETKKCHSLGDETDSLLESKQKLSPHFRSANVSLENDIYRFPSNSKNQLTPDKEIDALNFFTRKLSSQSLEEKQYSFKRDSKHTNSFYLSPNSTNEEFKVSRSAHLTHDKRQHSSGSIRTRSFREALNNSRKSKSFINEPRILLERSPIPANRRDSKIGATIDDIKCSPMQSDNFILIPDSVRAIAESRKSSNIDISETDSSDIIRPFQENRRKSSVLPIDKKKSTDLSENNNNFNNDDFLRKRNKIVCIILTVFCSLVFASVFVVVFTLTHSTDAPVQNHTRKVYTFSRDRHIPIHYNNGKYKQYCKH